MDVIIMAEENNIGLTEEDYQPSIDGQEEFYGNLLKFPACRELENCSEEEIREVYLSSIDINCTKLIDKIPLLSLLPTIKGSRIREKSALFSDIYFYLINRQTSGTVEIGIIDRDVGMDTIDYDARMKTPFRRFGTYDAFYALYRDGDLFPIFVDERGIRIEKGKILASPQLMAVFEILMNEIPEALAKITVKDSFKIDSDDTQLTNIESEMIEAQKNLIDSLKK